MKIIAWLELDVPGYPYRMERELTIPDEALVGVAGGDISVAIDRRVRKLVQDYVKTGWKVVEEYLNG